MKPPDYEFFLAAGRILNSGQARTLLLTGNIHDLFCCPNQDGALDYAPLIDFLVTQWNLSNRILVVYELNGPVRFVKGADRDAMRDAWLRWRTGLDADELAIKRVLSPSRISAQQDAIGKEFDTHLESAVGNPTLALELLRQMCLCSRTHLAGKPLLRGDLIILIEGADMVLPQGEMLALSDADRHRVSICQDWFSDPGFTNGGDSVVLLAESGSELTQRVARLPQVMEISVPAPDIAARKHFIAWFKDRAPDDHKPEFWSTDDDLAQYTAGLSIHALNQLLKATVHQRRKMTQEEVVAKVEEYIQSQLGEDIVEFKKPSHTLEDVVGFTRLKQFLREELIPRFQSSGPDALSGAAVAGPIGGGKTFVFEALATELDMVILVLKNIRSQWFGQTDVTFERLRRVLDALAKVLIFVDEADTQFGGIGPETHETERRLTGKIQAMMSDPKARGRVVWLLMTARIHLLSPDIRRPGRVGDLIIPVLDPTDEDRDAFLKWVVQKVFDGEPGTEQLTAFRNATEGYSAASYASLRSELRARSRAKQRPLTFDEVMAIVNDLLPPAITDTRRYQTLQALVNCTRRSLLPAGVTETQRQAWDQEIRLLEAKGIR